MRSWLGVNGYAFKDTIMSVAAKFQPQLDLAQRLAGHQDVANTRLYTEEAAISANLDAIDPIVVPGLHSRFGDYDDEKLR
jgi:hypothetical protein